MVNVQYANWYSRLLFRGVFAKQWFIPKPPARHVKAFLNAYEKLVLRPDIDGMEIDRPIFVLAMPRSGSSMLQDLLSLHRDVAYINNFMHLHWNCFVGAEKLRNKFGLGLRGERYLKDSVMVTGESASDPVMLWADWMRMNIYETSYHEYHMDEFSAEELARIFDDIKKCIWCFQGASRFLTKNPALLANIPFLSEMFPNGRFIFLVRDPRPCANSLVKLYRLCEEQRARISTRSYAHQPVVPYPRLPGLSGYIERWGSDSIETTARLWQDGIDEYLAYKGLLKNVFELRFEDVLADPKGTLHNLLAFCELPEDRLRQPAFGEQLARVGKVHHKNTSYSDFERIEELCSAGMARFGYERADTAVRAGLSGTPGNGSIWNAPVRGTAEAPA